MKTKHFKSRHALLMSLTSLMLCVSMLFGATFAWFTDSVTSGVNRIVSGNLDVELQYKDNVQTAYTGVTATTKLFNSAANGKLWEPGAMAYETFKVSNNGSLALKYQFALNTVDYNTVTRTSGSYDLRDVLKIAVVDTANFSASSRPDPATLDFKSWSEYANSAAFTGEILPGENAAQEKTVVIWWPDTNSNDVDNRYNLKDKLTDGWELNKTNNGKDELYIDLGITLVATQLQNESDSFDNTYDANAEYPSAVAYTIDSKASAELTANITEDEEEGVYTAPVNATAATIIADADATSTIPAATTFVLSDYSAPTTEDSTDSVTALSREIKTTESSSDSVTYDISYNATVTTTTGEEPPTTATYAVHTFDKIVTNEINVGTGLLNVSVTHGGVAMNKLTTGGVPAEPNENGDFYYDAGTGKLYIYSKTYSAYKVSFEQAEVSVKIDNATTNMTLAKFRDGVNDGTYANATVTLLRNVNLGGAEWTPIGTKTEPFKGSFDGKGHTISGLTLTSNNACDNLGLFGAVENAAVKSVKLEKFQINGEKTNENPDTGKGGSGALIGSAINGVTIENVSVDAQSKVVGKYAGGLVGYTNATLDGANKRDCRFLVTDCSSNAEIEGERCGGFIGRVDGSDNTLYEKSGGYVIFTRCTFAGSSHANSGDTMLSGGFVGQKTNGNGNQLTMAFIECSVNDTNVKTGMNSDDNTNIGTFIGFSQSGYTLWNCRVNGNKVEEPSVVKTTDNNGSMFAIAIDGTIFVSKGSTSNKNNDGSGRTYSDNDTAKLEVSNDWYKTIDNITDTSRWYKVTNAAVDYEWNVIFAADDSVIYKQSHPDTLQEGTKLQQRTYIAGYDYTNRCYVYNLDMWRIVSSETTESDGWMDTLSITSGEYFQDPSAYVPSGHSVTSRPSETSGLTIWTVS